MEGGPQASPPDKQGTYVPRHAAPEDPPIFEKLAAGRGDPTRSRDKPYFPKHLYPEDDPYSTAYYVPVVDISQLSEGPEAGEVYEKAMPRSELLWQPGSEPGAEPEEGQPPAPRPEPEEASFEPPAQAGTWDETREEAAAAQPQPKPEQKQRSPWLANPLLAAAVALKSWLSHPEKGRRRKTAAAIGILALAGTAAWLAGRLFLEDAPPPPAAVPPSKPGFAREIFDNLKPENYEGQRYEWGAAANDYSPAAATPEVLGMIDDARCMGATVNTWGNVGSGHWGISGITLDFTDGTQKTYYETEGKWAILQYLSKLRLSREDTGS